MRMTTVTGALVSAVLLSGCAAAPGGEAITRADANALHAAIGQLSDVIVYDIFSPPVASRIYAYSGIAAYETLRHQDTSYRSLAGQVNGLTPVPEPDAGVEYSFPLAGVHAMLTVARQMTFSRARMDSLRASIEQEFRKRGVSAAVAKRSVAYGERVAQHILAWSGTDRYKESRGYPKYTVTTAPGRWVPTPPAYMDAVEPNWPIVRPFVLDSASQFRPEPPFPFDTTARSPFFREAREVFEVRQTMTDEQRAIAAFWDCNPYVMHVQGHTMFATKKITPGGHWIGIIGIASRKAGADIVRSSEAYARTAVALADGFVSSWDEKYRSNLIRPETVINTYIEPGWQPLLQTPPFPEYTSGHSVISTAAATVLTDQFGDDFAFADSTEMEYGFPPRSFPSFRAAAEEAAISRLYGGIHYRRAIEQGIMQGRKVGELVVQRVRTRPDTPVIASPDVTSQR